MTNKEAILKVLKENKKPLKEKEVFEKIKEQNLTNSPQHSISAMLGDFIRKSDKRVKRFGKPYKYYWEKYADELNLQEIEEATENSESENQNANQTKNYKERDLHKLLSSYLKNENIYATTIFHEESKNKQSKNQKWIHPDMVGVKFLELKNKASNNLQNATNKSSTFDIFSYELKKEIYSDYQLKEYFFQAVSNSSWANYGYLVAFEIAENLKNEIERLSQSFGIGVIELKGNPFESKILSDAKKKALDFKTIDKLCDTKNPNFENFIKHIEGYLTANERYKKSVKLEIENFSEGYFEKDSEIKKYCEEKNIPYEDDEEI